MTEHGLLRVLPTLMLRHHGVTQAKRSNNSVPPCPTGRQHVFVDFDCTRMVYLFVQIQSPCHLVFISQVYSY